MKIMTNNLSFKGLWGKEDSRFISTASYCEAYMCDMGTNHVVKTKKYYPFKDETQKQIKSVVNSNKGVESYSNGAVENIVETEVKVMPKLNITLDEYNKYKNDDLLSKYENMVEDTLKLAGLKEYLIRNSRFQNRF